MNAEHSQPVPGHTPGTASPDVPHGTRPTTGGAPGGDVIPFRRAARTWFGISLQTFGGPAGQIAVMQRTLVEENRWIGQRRFNHALSYIGWLLNGTRGGLAAGTLFVLPGVLALLALSAIYVGWGSTTLITGLFAGLAPAVLAIVAQAVLRVGKRSLTHPAMVVLAVASFAALAVFAVPFPVVILAAAMVGWVLARVRPGVFAVKARGGDDDGPAPLIADDALHHEPPSWRRVVKVLAVGLAAWGIPLGAVAVLTGGDSVFTTQGLYFSGAALVTFGGAYAVLAYVAQSAVQTYGWLYPGEMVRGLALAETTPGPLIMVVQFVAFVGAYRDPGSLNPWAAALLGALLTTWVTFTPCFVFIFLGAPYVERLRGNRSISAALTGITAAVVGVIANLAVYFAVHTLFRTVHDRDWGPVQLRIPELATWRPTAVAITVIAFAIIFGLRWSVLRTLGVCALLGLAAALIW
ncbi:chromate transporter [Actinomadura soli]|uniref:Chromate transporter n=1 Tax=Actinomadura soli TaxID=2508997 RepID=A0A5C4JE04_9ACTN|nr:chromate transporter [Actinomadura soli]TMR02250.1 chromate transporter [Actinomadura soli]